MLSAILTNSHFGPDLQPRRFLKSLSAQDFENPTTPGLAPTRTMLQSSNDTERISSILYLCIKFTVYGCLSFVHSRSLCVRMVISCCVRLRIDFVITLKM